jgi:hypothetical protein
MPSYFRISRWRPASVPHWNLLGRIIHPFLLATGFDTIHFGRTVGSPPGLPGGGMTGVVPACGVGSLMSGSTLGGQRTPSVCSSFSLKV